MTCKKLYAVAALCLLPVSALAAPKTTPGDLPDLPLESLYFGGENPVLTPAEQKALKIARDWQARSATQLTPVPGPDGAIRFLHGSVQPSIVCAVMQVTDIELEPGEQINNISIGDSARLACRTRRHRCRRRRSPAHYPQAYGRRSGNQSHRHYEPAHLPLPPEKPPDTVHAQSVLQLSGRCAARFLALKERQTEEKEKLTIPETQE